MVLTKDNIDSLIIDTSLKKDEFISLQKQYKKDLKEATLTSGDRAEREIWLTFSYIGPKLITKKQISIPLTAGNSIKPDVICVFDEAVIVIEAKEGNTHYPSGHIDKIYGSKTEIQNFLKKNLNISHNNFIFILYYSEQILDNIQFANAQKKKIFLYSPKHKDFYQKIIDKLHEDAKDVIFSDLLAGHDWVDGKKENSIHVPCVKGKMGEKDFYQFLLSPEILKKISFVHRRYLQFMINNDEYSYQRIIKPNRLIEINEFIKSGKYFPNSILINFNQEIKFEQGTKQPKHSVGNLEFGYLVLPKKYGYAWIIDGQHRVFGYSGLPEHSRIHQLSVIATIQMPSREQAQLYVDINQNQKAIDQDDIWDLYTELEEPGTRNHEISKLIKDLNKNHPLYKDRIYIPSFKKDKTHYKINIANIAGSLDRDCAGIFDICTVLFISENHKPIKQINFDKFSLIVKYYFKQMSENKDIKELVSKQIFFGTNNGTDILLRLLNKFKAYLVVSHEQANKIVESDAKLKDYLEKFTRSLMCGIKDIPEIELKNFVKDSASAPKKANSDNILSKAAKYDEKIKEICNDIFLDNIKEGLDIEFKSSAIIDINGIRKDDVFKEEILGTIVGFINRGIKGSIYLGIDDNGKKIGINNELSYLSNGYDEYKRIILSSARDNIKISSNPPSSIDSLVELTEIKVDPKVVLITIKQPPSNAVSILALKEKKKAVTYFKTDAQNIQVNTAEYKQRFNDEKRNSLNELNSLFYSSLSR